VSAIVREVSAELGGMTVRADYRPVTTQNRFLLLVSGDIDLECGSGTNSSERQKQVAFSPAIFMTGTKLLVKRDSPVKSLRDLRRKTVVVTRDTTNAAAARLSGERVPTAEEVGFSLGGTDGSNPSPSRRESTANLASLPACIIRGRWARRVLPACNSSTPRRRSVSYRARRRP
jgi:hypothetical protein